MQKLDLLPLDGALVLCCPLPSLRGTAAAGSASPVRVPVRVSTQAAPRVPQRLTRDAVMLRGGAGQAARQVRGKLGGIAVAARDPQSPRPVHPRRLEAEAPGPNLSQGL